MANIVQFALNLTNNVSGPLRQASASVSNFVAQFQRAQQSTASASSSMGSSLSGLAGLAARAFSVAAIIGFGKEIISLGANMEQTRVRYEVFTGSAQKASEAIALVSKLATQTPFGKSELLEYGQKLIGAGLATDQMGQKLKTLGNISSATGKNLGELTSLYIKNKNSGIIQGEDLNQLSDAGISLKDFAKQLGTDVMGLKKLGSQGKVTFGDLDKYFESLGGTQGKWGNLNEKMSNTLAGKWSNLKDTLEQMFTDQGEEALPGLKALLDGANKVLGWVQENKANIGRLFEPLQKAIQPLLDGLMKLYGSLGVTGGITENLEKAFNAVGYAIQLISPFVEIAATAMGKLYEAVGKIISVFVEWVKKNDEVKGRALLLYNIFKTVFGAIGEIAGKVFGGIATTIDGILNKDFSKIGQGLASIVFAPSDTLANPDTYKSLGDKAPAFTDYFAKKTAESAAAATAGKSPTGTGGAKKAGDSTKLTTKIGDVAGTKLTNLNVKIERLIGVENQYNTTMKDAIRGAGEELKKTLLTALNDVSLTASQN
jgi:tape measure domain-containing protein